MYPRAAKTLPEGSLRRSAGWSGLRCLKLRSVRSHARTADGACALAGRTGAARHHQGADAGRAFIAAPHGVVLNVEHVDIATGDTAERQTGLAPGCQTSENWPGRDLRQQI